MCFAKIAACDEIKRVFCRDVNRIIIIIIIYTAVYELQYYDNLNTYAVRDY